MTTWLNEEIDPGGYGYGGYGEGPYGGEEVDWSNIDAQASTWLNESITEESSWENAL